MQRSVITGRARQKGLRILFGEAMSRVASKASRVYRGEALRHKSGRERTRIARLRAIGAERRPYPLQKKEAPEMGEAKQLIKFTERDYRGYCALWRNTSLQKLKLLFVLSRLLWRDKTRGLSPLVRRSAVNWAPKERSTRNGCFSLLERITGLEPATSTLARWRSTK